MIRVAAHSTVFVTVTHTPSWLARWLLGRRETVRDAQRVRVIGGTYAWVYAESRRDVGRRTAEAIESALAKHVARQRQERMRWRS